MRLRESMFAVLCLLTVVELLYAATYSVAPSGDDSHLGTCEKPLRTMFAASESDSILGQLQRGANSFTIWNCLPILGPDELPPAEWTR